MAHLREKKEETLSKNSLCQVYQAKTKTVKELKKDFEV